MLNRYLLPIGAASGLLLLAPGGPARGQAPSLTSFTPAANARAVPRTARVAATFSQPLTAGSAGALKIFSSQRGGLRGGGTAVVAGNTLTFAPTAYDFRPGETVQYTVTRAAASSTGALATPKVGQFTAAVGGTGRGTFANAPDVAVAGGPAAAALGDVDGDGDPDLVTANAASGLVGVALNTGTGTFRFSHNVAVSGSPLSVALGDLDGDGDLDLLAPDYNNGVGTSVSVRLNDGTGVFSGSQNVSVGLAPGDVALGDVDGDGDLDLVTANRGFIFMGSVSVRLNNGSGTFGGSQDLTLNGNAARVALADLDNDGDLDVLASNPNVSTVSVLLNHGAGLFGSSPDVGVGVAAWALATGDVDGDGDVDFAVGSLMSTGVRIYFNNGSGLFNASLGLTVGFFPAELVLGDLDADGDPDLLVAYDDNSTTSFVRVFLNDGLGAFSSGPQVSGALRSFRTVLADVDGDSDLDLLLPSAGGNVVSIRLNGGTGPLATAPGRAALAAPAMLAAYPNPATGRVTLALPPAATRAELLDALGRVARTVPAQAGAPPRWTWPA